MSVRHRQQAKRLGNDTDVVGDGLQCVPHPEHDTNVIGDGNCLFRCLAVLQYGDEEYFLRVRREICNYETPENAEASAAHFSKYLCTNQMWANNYWGTDDEIGRAGSLYNVRIMVYPLEAGTIAYDSGNPRTSTMGVWNLRILGHEVDSGTTDARVVSGSHYKVISKTTIPYSDPFAEGGARNESPTRSVTSPSIEGVRVGEYRLLAQIFSPAISDMIQAGQMDYHEYIQKLTINSGTKLLEFKRLVFSIFDGKHYEDGAITSIFKN